MRALQHEYPRWETDPNDPTGDADFVYPGRPRFVSKQRARKLRKRGVPLMPCHRVHDPHGEHRPGDFYPTHGDRARYAWFEVEAAYESRKRKRALHCYLVATRPEPFGRKGWLRARLETQRSMLQARLCMRAWRRASPRIAEFWASVPQLVQAPGETDREFVARGLGSQPHNLPRGTLSGPDEYAARRYTKHD